MAKPIYHLITRGSILNLAEKLMSDQIDPDRLYLKYLPYGEKTVDESEVVNLCKVLKEGRVKLISLELKLSVETFESAAFKKLIEELDPDHFRALRLSLWEGKASLNSYQANEVIKKSGIINSVSFPIVLDPTLDQELCNENLERVRRYKEENISSKNKNKNENKDDIDITSPQFRLKNKIFNPHKLSNNQSLEDNSVFNPEIVVEAEAEIEQNIEEAFKAEADEAVEAETGHYSGQKLNFEQLNFDFNWLYQTLRSFRNYIELSLLQQEILAPLPGAIRFITRAAAEKLLHDSNQLKSFNQDNLPEGMFLQKTESGEIILDYSSSYERNYNVFTPIVSTRFEIEEEPYYSTRIDIKGFPYFEIRNLFTDQTGVTQVKVIPTRLTNLYVRFGKEKVLEFAKLFVVDPNQKALNNCLNILFENYVNSFPQFDFMGEDNWFQNCINHIKKYDPDEGKLECLSSLLKASKNVRHDLEHTLKAFDVFWNELKRICPDKNALKKLQFRIPIEIEIEDEQIIPPTVALERVLTILKRSPDIESQIEYLSNMRLGNFQCNYAVTKEGFITVHPDMNFSWSPNGYMFYYFNEWPDNLIYFKNSFVYFNQQLFYINEKGEKEGEEIEVKNNSRTREILAELERKKSIRIRYESLHAVTNYEVKPIATSESDQVYAVNLSMLKSMAMDEETIDYPTFYAYLHRYMGQQDSGISYAEFRKQTLGCEFQKQDKLVAFALLFFITSDNYNEKIGLTNLINHLKNSDKSKLKQLCTALNNLKEQGIEFNNEEGIIILSSLAETKDPNTILNALKKDSNLKEYNNIFNQFNRLDKKLIARIKSSSLIKEKSIDADQLYTLLNTLGQFSGKFQKEIFSLLEPLPGGVIHKLSDSLNKLHEVAFPLKYFSHYLKLNEANELKVDEILVRFKKDKNDPILTYIFSEDFKGKASEASSLLTLTEEIDSKNQVVSFLKKHPLNNINEAYVLEIVAKSYEALRPNEKFTQDQLDDLSNELSKLNSNLEDQDYLVNIYKTTSPNSLSLLNALKKNSLSSLEVEPFGTRDDAIQFDTSQVERVINESQDWSNNTVYSFKYRKRLMESFTFVNEIGYKLPIFAGKTAKELTNKEIQDYFLGIKDNSAFRDVPDVQKKLIALALIREAMYRSTGRMAYSTQIISIIDSLMHNGNVISNIDTGQGKSLIDMSKAALLWLDSTRVDITTSSTMDAKRDLENFAPFFRFLKIPYAKKPITSQSDISDFEPNGINLSTFAQMSLFQAKMKLEGKELGLKTDRVSVIVNESDNSLLEDRTIYRYSVISENALAVHDEWIYTAINEFVLSNIFTKNNTSKQQDIVNLKKYLMQYAKEKGKNNKIIDDLSFSQCEDWINAAMVVNYQLKEKRDFFILEEPEFVKIRGKWVKSHVIKIPLTEGKAKTKLSEDAKFGNGIQQLLYAKLNEEYKNKNMKFVIEPETKTIVSSNNKNFMDYYLNRLIPGIIWGSSGTVGSKKEREELFAKYGFSFSKIEPHQKKIVEVKEPFFFEAEDALHLAVVQDMAEVKLDDAKRPEVIFCEDTESAEKLFNLLKKTHSNIQIYTGETSKEEEAVRNAARGGMITVTTAAFGRNTDILYARGVGLNVTLTSVDSINLEAQKAGRTGREGSPGTVKYYFDKKKLNGKTKEQIQAEIYDISKKERAYYEEIYSILGNVQSQLEKKLDDIALQVQIRSEQNKEQSDEPGKNENKLEEEKLEEDNVDKQKGEIDAFLRTKWPEYSIVFEKDYKELKWDQKYNTDEFISNLVKQLDKEGQKLDKEQILNSTKTRFQSQDEYNPYTQKVTKSDCILPVEIAYRLVNQQHTDETKLKEKDINEIDEAVGKLLKNYAKGNSSEPHRDYIRFLTATPATQKQIREIHEKHLKNFLNENKSMPWYKRWCGYNSLLHKISNSANYLLLFRALVSVPVENSNKKTEIEIVKTMINLLLNEFRSNAWFLGSNYKKQLNQLLNELHNSKDLNSIVQILNKSHDLIGAKEVHEKYHRSKLYRWFSNTGKFEKSLRASLNFSAALNIDSDDKKALEEAPNPPDAVAPPPTAQNIQVHPANPIENMADELKSKPIESVKPKEKKESTAVANPPDAAIPPPQGAKKIEGEVVNPSVQNQQSKKARMSKKEIKNEKKKDEFFSKKEVFSQFKDRNKLFVNPKSIETDDEKLNQVFPDPSTKKR